MRSAVLTHAATRSGSSSDGRQHPVELQINRLEVEELFALYRRAGFLYPAKAARLTPHLQTIETTWRRLLLAGDSLLQVLTVGDDRDGIASIAAWRTTPEGWVWQHLVSERNPLHSGAVMLGGLERCMREGTEESQQNWFRPDNRFPARVFGTIVGSLGESLSSVREYAYLSVSRDLSFPDSGLDVVPCDETRRDALIGLATRARGSLYVTAEALETDMTLASVDALYRRVGLRRTRHVWLAYRRGQSNPLGAAIAYRGPLGLNFSFLENRCDLLLDPAVDGDDAREVAMALLGAVREAYIGFELQEIPVLTEVRVAAVIAASGGQWLRNYCQGIWLKQGQPQLYQHLNRFYSGLLARAERRAQLSSLTA